MNSGMKDSSGGSFYHGRINLCGYFFREDYPGHTTYFSSSDYGSKIMCILNLIQDKQYWILRTVN